MKTRFSGPGVLLFVLISLFTLGSFNSAGAKSANDQPQRAPANKAFLDFLESVKRGAPRFVSDDGHPLGYVPPPVDLSHVRGVVDKNVKAYSHPVTYDLRTLGKLSPVRNQGGCGSCWTFGTYSSLESKLLPAQACNFSEQDLNATHGFDYAECAGGNANMSHAYLARWSGPLNESDVPYPYVLGYSPLKHVQQVIWLPARANATDNDTVKDFIMNHGAVYFAFYWNSANYNGAAASYYCPTSTSANHAVAFVGWDDNYSASNFSSAPPGNGAFIVRNSWGSGWGQSGYFYISYYDATITEIVSFNNAQSASNYTNNIQYDPLGWVSGWGYGTTVAWGANIFTAPSNDPVQAVGFITPDANTQYTITIYTGVTAGNPVSGTLAATKSGTTLYPGYYTVVLDSSVTVTAGQKFSVVIKFQTSTYTWPVCTEDNAPGYSSSATTNTGESFLSSNGTSWADMNSQVGGGNCCIKAFSKPQAVPPTLSTTAVTDITMTGAQSGGNITSNGGAAVTARGVCWSTTSDPTTADSKTVDGTGMGSYVSSLTGLTSNTPYHVRAYATNSAGTAYGNDVEFTTLASPTLPTVETTAVTSLTRTIAQGGGNVIAEGAAAVTERGVCWSTAVNPTTSNSHTHDGPGTGTFVSSLSGLSPNTTYHVRAYATNSVDTAYGDDLQFATPVGGWAASRRLTWTPGASGEPAIAAGSAANLHLVWSDGTPGHEDLHYKRSTDGGANWAAGQRLTWASSGAASPALAADSSDNLHIVWQDSSSGNAEIYYKRSTDGGATWTSTQRLTWTSGQSYGPTIAVDPSGNPHVVWEDHTPGNAEIYYRNSLDGGATWATAKRITWTSGGSFYPVIAVDSSGDQHVVWWDDTPGNREIYHKKSTDGGGTWTTAQRITWTSGHSVHPANALDSLGNLHVVWEDSTPGNNETYYKGSPDGGATWTTAKRITLTSGDSQFPAGAVDPSDHVHVVWEDLTPGNWEIYYSKSTDGGATWTSSQRLTWTSDDSRRPAIAADSFGNLHVVWPDSTPGNSEIYYRKFIK